MSTTEINDLRERIITTLESLYDEKLRIQMEGLAIDLHANFVDLDLKQWTNRLKSAAENNPSQFNHTAADDTSLRGPYENFKELYNDYRTQREERYKLLKTHIRSIKTELDSIHIAGSEESWKKASKNLSKAYSEHNEDLNSLQETLSNRSRDLKNKWKATHGRYFGTEISHEDRPLAVEISRIIEEHWPGLESTSPTQ